MHVLHSRRRRPKSQSRRAATTIRHCRPTTPIARRGRSAQRRSPRVTVRVNGCCLAIETPMKFPAQTPESERSGHLKQRQRVLDSRRRNHVQGFDPFENPFTQSRLFTVSEAVTLLEFVLTKAFSVSAMVSRPPFVHFFQVQRRGYGPGRCSKVLLNRDVGFSLARMPAFSRF